MQFKIQQEILNKILGYLALRPYSEVVLLIKEIQDGVEAMGEVVENDSEGV